MAEYIEREAALNFEVDSVLLVPDALQPFMDGMAFYAEHIKRLPVEDVAPVRHGRWIKARGSWCTPGGDPVWECSECGKGMHVYGVEHGSYGSDVADSQWVACPNCGARMDGDGDV